MEITTHFSIHFLDDDDNDEDFQQKLFDKMKFSLSLTLSEFFELGETWSTKRQNKKKNILNKIYMVSLGSEKKQWARDALSERKGKKKYFSIFVVWTIWRQPISFSCSTMVSGSFSQRNYWTLNLQSRFYQISSPFLNPPPSPFHRQAFAQDFLFSIDAFFLSSPSPSLSHSTTKIEFLVLWCGDQEWMAEKRRENEKERKVLRHSNFAYLCYST